MCVFLWLLKGFLLLLLSCVRGERELGFEALFENRVFGASQCLNGLVTNSEGPRAL
jgi:hypothetical protein